MTDRGKLFWPAGRRPLPPGIGPLYTGSKGPRVVLRPYREGYGSVAQGPSSLYNPTMEVCIFYMKRKKIQFVKKSFLQMIE